MNIDRNGIRIISSKVMEALAPLEKELGVKFSQGRAMYSFSTGSIKIDISGVQTSGGKVLSKEAVDFEQLAQMFGLKKSDLNSKFTFGGDTYKIVGIKPKSWKRPIIAEKVGSGQRYKFAAEDVKNRI